MSAALDLARRALAAAGDDALATVTRERSTTLRFARSRPTQATSVDDLAIEIAAVRAGHVGRAATNRTDSDALADCARAAVRAAEAAAARGHDGHFPGFPGPEPLRTHHGHDPETARLDPATGGDALRAAFDVAERTGVEAGGIWTAAEVETTLASSTGIEATDRVTDAFMKVIATAPSGSTGYAAQTAVAATDIDPDALAERASAKATIPGDPTTVDPGEHTVVMEPHAVAELLWALGETAFDGLAHAEGRGALTNRLGTRVVSPAVNLSDSPRFPATLPRAFDAEGIAKRPLPLIQDGIAHRVVHDTRSASVAANGASSTGHALVPGGQASGPRPTNLVMVGGGAQDEHELCAPVERGIYITRLWYTNIVRPADTLFTAVTRDGTFLIEDGKLTRPLGDVRITDTALGVLSRIQALAAHSTLTSDGELYGRRFATGSVCPALRAHDVRITGTAAD